MMVLLDRGGIAKIVFLYDFLHYRNMSLINLVNKEKIHVDTASILPESVLVSRAGLALDQQPT
jgi:hypothetical protein